MIYIESFGKECHRPSLPLIDGLQNLMAEEQKIERKLVKAVKDIGGMALKFVSPGCNGVPDRLILIAFGKIAFVEVKAPGKKPRPIQVIRINQIRKLGFKVFVLDDPKQIPTIIEEIKGEAKNEVQTS